MDHLVQCKLDYLWPLRLDYLLVSKPTASAIVTVPLQSSDTVIVILGQLYRNTTTYDAQLPTNFFIFSLLTESLTVLDFINFLNESRSSFGTMIGVTPTNQMKIGSKHTVTVNLKNISVPFLNILAKKDDLVAPSSSRILNDIVGSKDKNLMEFNSGHVGARVSPQAHQELWTKAAEWIVNRS
jgi:hypothetical protein